MGFEWSMRVVIGSDVMVRARVWVGLDSDDGG